VASVDLAPEALEIVRAVLARHLAGREVRVMGSRVFGRAKPFSDLDLVVMGEDPLPLATLADLRDDFDDANLPCSVDIIEWASASDSFRRIIVAQAHPFRLATNT
jgi:predicted nucleotidyltransferase